MKAKCLGRILCCLVLCLMGWGLPAQGSPQGHVSRMMRQDAQRAYDLLRRAWLRAGLPTTRPSTRPSPGRQQVSGRGRTWRCKGMLWYEGHYASPGQTRTFRQSFRLSWSSDGRLWGWEESVSPLRVSRAWTTRLLLASRRGLLGKRKGSSFRVLRSSSVQRWKRRLVVRSPRLLLAYALRFPKRIRWVRTIVEPHTKQKRHVVSFASPNGPVMHLFLDAKHGMLRRVVRLAYDEMAGDHTVSWLYAAAKTANRWHVRKFVGNHLRRSWTCKYERGSRVSAIAKGWRHWRRALGLLRPTPHIKDLGKGLYSFALPGDNHRVLVVAFRAFLVVLEAPVSYRVGRQLLSVIRKTFPRRPIKYVVVTHHHPDHAGGVRPFLITGSRLVTTQNNIALFARMMKQRHSFSPSVHARWATRQTRPSWKAPLVVKGEHTIKDNTQSLRLIDIGALSHHTNEYLVAYVPGRKLLFEGDLVNFRRSVLRPANKRGEGLYNAIAKWQLSVDVVMQSWPRRTTRELTPFSTLKKMVHLRRQKQRSRQLKK